MLGSKKLQITGHSASGVVAIAEGDVSFGGVFLNATRDSLHIDDVLQKTSSVQISPTYRVILILQMNGSLLAITAGRLDTADKYDIGRFLSQYQLSEYCKIYLC